MGRASQCECSEDWPQSEPLVPEAMLPPLLDRMRLHAGFPLGLLACGAVQLSGDETGVLSQRERQVFRLLGSGSSGRAIAAELGVSVKTVETHRQRIKDKLQLKTGAEVNRRAAIAANGHSH